MSSIGAEQKQANLWSDDARRFLKQELHLPVIRQSSLKTLFTCERKFLFAERFRLARGRHKSAPFIGNLFHLAHNCRYRKLSPEQTRRILYQTVNEYLARLLEWAAETENAGLAETIDKDVRDEAMLAEVMSEIHMERYPLMPGAEPIAIEKDVSVKVPGIGVPLAGQIDLVLKLKDPVYGEGVLIVDHKTVGYEPWIMGATASFDSQVRLYRILAAALGEVRGLPVIGFMHNVIRRPTIRPKAPSELFPNGQSYAEFLEECRDWYDAKTDSRGVLGEDGSPVVFKSGPRKGQPKPRWSHEDKAKDWLVSKPIDHFVHFFAEDPLELEFKEKLVRHEEASTILPRLSSYPTTGKDNGSCSNTYGKPCEFLSLCTTDPENWETEVLRSYHVREADEMPDSPEEVNA